MIEIENFKEENIEMVRLEAILYKMPPSEKFIFYLLEHSDKNMLSRSDLIRKTRFPNETITVALRKLIKKEIIRKVLCQEQNIRKGKIKIDKRFTLYFLTENGKKLIGC